MLLKDEEFVRDRIRKALADEKHAEDIAFHMTDWKSDLEGMIDLYGDENLSAEKVRDIVTGFVIHVSNHLNAAQKLLGFGPVTDVFELGIFKWEDED